MEQRRENGGESFCRQQYIVKRTVFSTVVLDMGKEHETGASHHFIAALPLPSLLLLPPRLLVSRRLLGDVCYDSARDCVLSLIAFLCYLLIPPFFLAPTPFAFVSSPLLLFGSRFRLALCYFLLL